MSSVLDIAASQTSSKNQIRDDQASILVLACATFRNILPKQHGKCNMAKYLLFYQESISHARWLTTASRYLRMKLYDIYDLDAEQKVVLHSIVQCIIDVYVPSFFQMYKHPSAVQDPTVILQIRDYLKASDKSMPAKRCFLDHGIKWLNPKTPNRRCARSEY